MTLVAFPLASLKITQTKRLFEPCRNHSFKRAKGYQNKLELSGNHY